eukprot:13028966-Alexandrium_andersonii.AAC.1
MTGTWRPTTRRFFQRLSRKKIYRRMERRLELFLVAAFSILFIVPRKSSPNRQLKRRGFWSDSLVQLISSSM